jgi:hypothetical protein
MPPLDSRDSTPEVGIDCTALHCTVLQLREFCTVISRIDENGVDWVVVL